MKKIKLITLLLICITSYPSYAQKSIDELDKLVSFCQENGMFNGNILVAEKGEIIYHQSIGKADFENDISLNLNSSFCLGSISKQFTAFGIMLLKKQGKLTYTSTVGEIFPELPKYMHKITLKNLMQHTSGLKRTHYGDPDGLKNEDIYQNFLQTKGDTLLFEPGTDLRYSNSGYMLLAMIVERVSGQTFESFLHEKVWQPLGMTNTYVMSKTNYSRQNRAIGFDGFGNKSDFNVLTYGSNGIYSSTEDLFRWLQSFNSDLIMDLDDKSEAWRPALNNSGEPLFEYFGAYKWNYGFGLFICDKDLKGVIGHTGAFGGFLNIMKHDFENDRDIIILTNNGRMIPVTEVSVAILNILNHQAYTLPKISIDFELRKNYYNDIEGGIQYYHQLKKDHPNKYKFDNEWELNRLGYALIADKRYEDAVKILELLVSEFSGHPNPHDSLGEAYFLNGQHKKSIESYKNALAIDENFNLEWINKMIKKNNNQLNTKHR